MVFSINGLETVGYSYAKEKMMEEEEKSNLNYITYVIKIDRKATCWAHSLAVVLEKPIGGADWRLDSLVNLSLST